MAWKDYFTETIQINSLIYMTLINLLTLVNSDDIDIISFYFNIRYSEQSQKNGHRKKRENSLLCY